MKNILYICDYGAIYTGSFIAAMAMLTQRAGEKYQVYFLFPETARGRKWLPLLPVPEERIYFSDFSVKSLAAACHRLSAELKPDSTVVHTHFVGDFRLLAVRSAFSDIICHYHMMVPIGYTLMKKVKQLIRRVIYWGLVIVGVSEAVQKDAVRYFWNVRSECVPNAIDFDMLEKCSAEPVLLDAAHTGQFRVLVHGSDFFCKGADLAIQAILALNREQENQFRLYLTSNHVEKTKEQIRQITGETDNITVLQSVENIKSLYDSMDLYISPSREEAFGYAVVEAAYSDCQVAASDIPGQNTMKQVPGILWFGKDDLQGLQNAILQARRNLQEGKVPEIKKPQREYVLQEFRIDRWVERNMALYDKYYEIK